MICPRESAPGAFCFVGMTELFHDPGRMETKRKSPSFAALSQAKNQFPDHDD